MRWEYTLLFFLFVVGSGAILYALRDMAASRAPSRPPILAAPAEPIVLTCSICGIELTDADDLGYSMPFDQGDVIFGTDGLCATCRKYNPH